MNFLCTFASCKQVVYMVENSNLKPHTPRCFMLPSQKPQHNYIRCQITRLDRCLFLSQLTNYLLYERGIGSYLSLIEHSIIYEFCKICLAFNLISNCLTIPDFLDHRTIVNFLYFFTINNLFALRRWNRSCSNLSLIGH